MNGIRCNEVIKRVWYAAENLYCWIAYTFEVQRDAQIAGDNKIVYLILGVLSLQMTKTWAQTSHNPYNGY